MGAISFWSASKMALHLQFKKGEAKSEFRVGNEILIGSVKKESIMDAGNLSTICQIRLERGDQSVVLQKILRSGSLEPTFQQSAEGIEEDQIEVFCLKWMDDVVGRFYGKIVSGRYNHLFNISDIYDIAFEFLVSNNNR